MYDSDRNAAEARETSAPTSHAARGAKNPAMNTAPSGATPEKYWPTAAAIGSFGKYSVRTTATPERTTGTRNDQWRRSCGSARRSSRSSIRRNDDRNAARMLGRRVSAGPGGAAPLGAGWVARAVSRSE